MSARVLTLDIETSPLLVYTFGLFKQNISINQIKEPTRVISWAAKWHDENRVRFMSEYHHGREPMLEEIWNLINEADIVVHFNGDSFDQPHLNREFKLVGAGLYAPVKSVDLYRQLKKVFNFPSYKLDYIAQALSVGAKVSHSGFDLWRHCIEPSPADDPNRQRRAWNLMRKYNKGDVTVAEDLYDETLAWLPTHPNMALYEDDHEDADCCPRCTSTNRHREGYALLEAGKYPRYQCNDCGRFWRSKKAVVFSSTRSA